MAELSTHSIARPSPVSTTIRHAPYDDSKYFELAFRIRENLQWPTKMNETKTWSGSFT